MVRRYLGGRLPGIEEETVVALGDSGRDGVFDLGAVAIRLSSTTNGVSRRHGEVVTRDWERIIGGPGRAVTNGVHVGTWVGPQMARNFEVALGDAWSENALRPEAWAAIYQIDDQDLWRAHQAQKDRLIRHLRRRMRDQRARHGESPEDLRRITTLLPADRLTITFARRFATYKRAGLLLSDVERLGRVLTHPERPIQIVFAGKAHPADREGQSSSVRSSRWPEAPTCTDISSSSRTTTWTSPGFWWPVRTCGSTPRGLHGSERDLGHEGSRERRPQPQCARRVVGRRFHRVERLGIRRTS